MEKILVIDDDKMIRKLFSLSLTKAGYTIIEAESGEEGLKPGSCNYRLSDAREEWA